MAGLIQHVEVDDVSLAPAQAELRLTVTLNRDWGETEVRGRLMGPRCLLRQTVEIAYPLRPLPGPAPGPRSRCFRVIIPEVSWWDLASPFLYEGPVEVWRQGQCLDQAWVSHGLRSLTLSARGWRLNGKPLALCGREVERTSADDLADWRAEGVNLLVTSLRPDTEALWPLAGQQGLLVLGRLPDTTPATRERAARLAEHPSALGWLVPSSEPADWVSKGLAGSEVKPGGGPPPPAGVRFVLLRQGTALEGIAGGMPALIREEQTGLIRPATGTPS